MSNLGITINLLRHGFHRVPGRDFSMRISGDGPFKVELRPFERITSTKRDSHPYRIWWDQCSCKQTQWVDLIKPIRTVVRVKRPITFLINDEGEWIP